MSRAPRDKPHYLENKREIRAPKDNPPAFSEFSRSFIEDKVTSALRDMCGIYDNIHPEFLTRARKTVIRWLANFFSNILITNHLNMEFKKSFLGFSRKPAEQYHSTDEHIFRESWRDSELAVGLITKYSH